MTIATTLPRSNTESSAVSLSRFNRNERYVVVIDEERGYQTLIAQKAFAPGDIVSAFSVVEVHKQPSYYSVQVGKFLHITLYPVELQYINHSCEPNVFFDTHRGEVVCLKPIQLGEAMTFFYPSTEWDMSDGFSCLCGSDHCLGHIQGAKYLSQDILNRYELSRHIKRLRQER